MTREAKVVFTAEDRTGAAVRSVKSGLADMTQKASLAAGTLAGLGGAVTIAGMVALAKSVADSLDAFNDLRDATGASIENISALESVARRNGTTFDTVGGALVKYNAALTEANKSGTDASRVFQALGLNAKQLRDMDPAEALRQTAVALNQFADDGNKARAVQELFGKSLREVAPFLKDLAEAGQLNATVTQQQAEEAEKFNKQLLAMRAHTEDLKREMLSGLLPALNAVLDALRKGGLRAGLDELGNRAFDWQGNAQRKGISWAEEAARDATQRARTSPNPFVKQQLEAEARAQKEKADALRRAYYGITDLQGGRGVVNPALVDARDSMAAVAAAKVTKAVKENTEAEKELAIWVAYRRKQYLDAHDAQAKAIEEINRAYLEGQKIQGDMDREALVSIESRVVALQTELNQVGMLQSQIEALSLARMEDARAAAAAGAEDTEAIDQRIDAYRRYVALLQRKEAVDAQRSAAQEASRAWEQVAQSMTDALMRGGRSVAQYLKDLFRTLVLRPILAPVGTAMGGLIGAFPGAANAGGTGVLGMLGNFGGLGGGFGGFSSGLSAGAGALFGEAGLMGALDAGGIAMGAGNMLGGLGTIMGALGPIVGGLALVASLLKGSGETRSGGQYNFGNLIAGPSGGELGAGSSAAKITADTINATLALLGSSSRLTNFMTGLESSEKGKGFAYAGGTLTTGGVFGQGWGAGFTTDGHNNRRGDMTPEQAVAAFGEELKQATLQAIQAATGVPEAVMKLVRDKDFDAMAEAELDATLTQVNAVITSVDSFRVAVAMLPFQELKTLSFDLASALGDAAGGMDKLLASLNTYYSEFFTAEEQRLNTARNISSVLRGAGADFSPEQVLAATRGQFRQVVEAFEGRTDAGGQQIYAALLSVAGAFASITDEVAPLPAALDDTSDALRDAAQAQEEYARSLGDAGRSISAYIRELSTTQGGLASPLALLTNTRANYLTDLGLARQGNLEASGRISGSAAAYVDAQKGYTASGTATSAVIAQVLSELQSLPAVATYEQQMLASANEQLAYLAAITVNTGKTATFTGLAGAVPSGAASGSGGGAAWGGSPTASTGGAAWGGSPTVANIGTALGGIDWANPEAATAQLAGYMRTNGWSASDVAGVYSWFTPGQVADHLKRAGYADVVPGFAAGGYTPGGLAMVGERGPELVEFGGPARVYNAADTARMVSGGATGEAKIERLCAQVEFLTRVVADGFRRETANTSQLVAASQVDMNARLLAQVGQG